MLMLTFGGALNDMNAMLLAYGIILPGHNLHPISMAVSPKVIIVYNYNEQETTGIKNLIFFPFIF